MRVATWILLAAVLFPVSPAGGQEAAVSIRYYGHSFFLVTAAGLRIAIDPFGEIGYPMPDVEGDVVLITHEHRDHNNAGLVRGARRVLRGLTAGGRDWAKIYERIGQALFYSLPSFHDNESGTARGLNSFFVVEAGGLRMAHLGDIGHHPLGEGLLRALGRIDVLMIPVGGEPFTIGAREATVVADQIRPAIVIPMHYRTAARPDWPGTDERPFIEGKRNVRHLGTHTLVVARDRLPAATQVVVMSYR